MKLSFAAAITALAGLASARIDAFAVPKTIKPGDEFTVSLEGHGYIQTQYEVAAAFGITGQEYQDSLQTVLDSVYLGPDKSNTQDKYNYTVTLPEDTKEGPYTFSVALFKLEGALNSPYAETYSVNVTVGKETSSEFAKTLAY
ncbi:hypothetical protein KEM55_002948 [Ascosphaera atra]|nr:hypothetical protein KEM55_002948 [Ascosphaera atra]